MILNLIKTLGLEWDVNLTFKHETNSEAVAEYSCDDESGHVIEIFVPEALKDARTLDVIIAHELIHAWQEEQGHKDTHGRSFKKMARKIERDFSLSNVFDPSVDV